MFNVVYDPNTPQLEFWPWTQDSKYPWRASFNPLSPNGDQHQFIKGLNGQHNNSITFLQDRLWNVRGFSHAEESLKKYANDKNSCLLNPGQLVTHISKVNKVFCE